MQSLQTETHFASVEACKCYAKISLLIKCSCLLCLEIEREPSGKYFMNLEREKHPWGKTWLNEFILLPAFCNPCHSQLPSSQEFSSGSMRMVVQNKHLLWWHHPTEAQWSYCLPVLPTDKQAVTWVTKGNHCYKLIMCFKDGHKSFNSLLTKRWGINCPLSSQWIWAGRSDPFVTPRWWQKWHFVASKARSEEVMQVPSHRPEHLLIEPCCYMWEAQWP